MSESTIANKQLSTLLGVLSHPSRIRIVRELQQGERDVNTLQRCVKISHSGVSQHLSVMRANRLVAERREGRRVLYRLVEPKLADWLLEGLHFLEAAEVRNDAIRNALRLATADWTSAEIADRNHATSTQRRHRGQQ